jgi:hypothetical protein
MLRLKRLPKDRVTIYIQDKSRTLDIRFWRSLFYSLLFHVIVFGSIRIEYLRIHESTIPLVPVEVAIDNAPEEMVIADTGDLENARQKKFIHLAAHYSEVPYIKKTNEFDLAAQLQALQNSPLILSQAATHHESPLPAAPPSSYPEKCYPMRIELTSGLQELQLVRDGSILFRQKKTTDMLSKLKLTTRPLFIDYEVRVCGNSGKIIGWKRTHELLDKKLQELADRIIQEIGFGKQAPDTQTGVIRLIFECSGVEIEQYLDGYRYD